MYREREKRSTNNYIINCIINFSILNINLQKLANEKRKKEEDESERKRATIKNDCFTLRKIGKHEKRKLNGLSKFFFEYGKVLKWKGNQMHIVHTHTKKCYLSIWKKKKSYRFLCDLDAKSVPHFKILFPRQFSFLRINRVHFFLSVWIYFH